MHLLILFGVVLPAAVAALVVAPLRVRPQLAPRLLGSIAVAGGFVAAFYALGFAPLRPNEWWPWLALAGVLVGGLPMPIVLRIVLWAGVAAFAKERIVPPGLSNDEEWEPWRIQCYTTVAVICVLGLGLQTLYARRPALLVRFYIVAAAGGAGVLFWSGNALFAQMAGALAAALAAVGLFSRSGPAATGATAVSAVLHPALLAAGCFNHFSDVPTWVFAVAALAPVGGYAVSALPFAKPPGRG